MSADTKAIIIVVVLLISVGGLGLWLGLTSDKPPRFDEEE